MPKQRVRGDRIPGRIFYLDVVTKTRSGRQNKIKERKYRKGRTSWKTRRTMYRSPSITFLFQDLSTISCDLPSLVDKVPPVQELK